MYHTKSFANRHSFEKNCSSKPGCPNSFHVRDVLLVIVLLDFLLVTRTRKDIRVDDTPEPTT